MVDEFPDQGGSRPGSRIGSPSKSQILRKGHKNWSLVAHRFGRVQGVVEAMISSQHKPVKKINGMDIPEKIEDVPLRNQDRRLLNARHKRLIAKRIICFGISTSLIFLGLGIALIEIHCLSQKGKQSFLWGAFLEGALLKGAFLEGALLERCVFRGCSFRGVRL